MTREEIERITGTMHVLKSLRLPCWYAVLGDAVLDMPEAEARAIFSAATSYIAQAQGRAGYPQHWLRVLESTGGLHANIVFPAPPEVAARFKRSEFGAFCQGAGFQQIGPTRQDWRTLTSYLSGERTSQAERAVGHLLGPRVKGAHYLGEGGGDRVRLSPALYDDALRLGLIEPYQKTKSKALTRSRKVASPAVDPQPEAPTTMVPEATDIAAPAEISRAVEAITPARFIIGSQSEAPIKIGSEANDAGAPAEASGAGQEEAIRLTPVISVVEGPRDGIGWDRIGHGAQSECPSCPVEPAQLLLFTALPLKAPPFSDGAEVRELRQRTGLSQERLAGQIGIRDRSHLANVERGHDRLSPQRRRLLRYIADTRLAA